MPVKESKWKAAYRESLVNMSNRELFDAYTENVGAAESEMADNSDYFRLEASTAIIEERLNDWLED